MKCLPQFWIIVSKPQTFCAMQHLSEGIIAFLFRLDMKLGKAMDIFTDGSKLLYVTLFKMLHSDNDEKFAQLFNVLFPTVHTLLNIHQKTTDSSCTCPLFHSSIRKKYQ
jgi:hypothetical protein